MDPSHSLDRWLYRGRRPNRLARLLNTTGARLAAAGIGPARQVMVEVSGRRSGKAVRFPLVIADLDGDRFLVSMLGQNTNWVRNVRAAGGRVVLRHGRSESVVLEEVDPAERPAVLRRYLDCAPGARAHIPVDRHAPIEEFERIAADYPVFRVRGSAPHEERATPRSPEVEAPVRVPPPWVVSTAWRAHRALYRASGGHIGLWTPASKRGWGALRLSAVGRRSGRSRAVILGYLSDGPNLVVLAMNGWGEGEPAWWLNLQANHLATVHLADGRPRRMTAYEAQDAERDRLWALWRSVDPNLDQYAALRSTPTAVVVLAPV
jgi:deazaflavin-dependent oxidoreductase (nitroreductase family)